MERGDRGDSGERGDVGEVAENPCPWPATWPPLLVASKGASDPGESAALPGVTPASGKSGDPWGVLRSRFMQN